MPIPHKYLKKLLVGIVIISIVFGLNQIHSSHSSHYFPIKKVRIYGMKWTNQEEVKSILSPLVNQGFFALNVENIRDRLLQIPWLSDLYVRRIWPDQVEITMIERHPIAYWNEDSLLSDMGEIFTPQFNSNIPISLPKLAGPSGQHIYLMQNYKNMDRILSPLHVKISYLELTPDFTWKLVLDNGMVMHLGQTDGLVRLNHFVKVYSKIVGTKAANVDYVDLRYSNGVAVRWKKTVMVH